MVTKVNEKNASVVADGIYPSCEHNLATDVLNAKLIAVMCSEHTYLQIIRSSEFLQYIIYGIGKEK